MSFEIQGPTGRSPAEIGDNSTATRKPGERNAPSATTTPTGSQDRFSLTDQAAQIQALEQQISELPVVDTQRVAGVQQAIESGDLRINAESVANKILELEVGLSATAA